MEALGEFKTGRVRSWPLEPLKTYLNVTVESRLKINHKKINPTTNPWVLWAASANMQKVYKLMRNPGHRAPDYSNY